MPFQAFRPWVERQNLSAIQTATAVEQKLILEPRAAHYIPTWILFLAEKSRTRKQNHCQIKKCYIKFKNLIAKLLKNSCGYVQASVNPSLEIRLACECRIALKTSWQSRKPCHCAKIIAIPFTSIPPHTLPSVFMYWPSSQISLYRESNPCHSKPFDSELSTLITQLADQQLRLSKISLLNHGCSPRSHVILISSGKIKDT